MIFFLQDIFRVQKSYDHLYLLDIYIQNNSSKHKWHKITVKIILHPGLTVLKRRRLTHQWEDCKKESESEF